MHEKLDVLAMGVDAAARAVDMSPWTIRKMIRDGRLTATRFSRRVLIEPSELRRLIEKGRQTQKADG